MMTPLKDATLLVQVLVVSSLLSQLSVSSEPMTGTQRTTDPQNPTGFKQVSQTETNITLQWNKVEGVDLYHIEYMDETLRQVNVSEGLEEKEISGLQSMTKYNFSLFSVFGGNRSSGVNLAAFTAPPPVTGVEIISQTETNITLQWNQVEGVDLYQIEYMDEALRQVNVSETLEEKEISGLQSMTKYNFTLFSVWEGIRSSGENVTAFTAPPPVAGVEIISQTETNITLQWNETVPNAKYILKYENNEPGEEVHPDSSGPRVTYTVSNLTAGRKYSFTLITVFEGVNSNGFDFQAVTAPPPVTGVEIISQTETSITLQWNETVPNKTYILKYENNEPGEEVHPDSSGPRVTHTVSNLGAGRNYSFTLITVFEGVNSAGFNFQAVTAPLNPKEFRKVSQTETNITLQWIKVEGVDLYQIEYMDETLRQVIISETLEEKEISGLQNMTQYKFTLFSVFGGIRSSGVNLTAFTAPPPVSGVKTISQTKTSITLSWATISNDTTYILKYENNGPMEVPILPSSDQSVTYNVSNLSAGINYIFTLITVFEDVNSTGFNFHIATVPPMVAKVTVTSRTVSSLTLSWDRQVDKNWTYILDINGASYSVTGGHPSDNCTINDLEPGTKYKFSVTTQFSGLKSTPYEGNTVTTIDCANGTWNVTTSSIDGEVKGLFTSAEATNHSLSLLKKQNLSFTGLTPGETYEIVLLLENESEHLEQCRHFVTILPSKTKAHCPYFKKGYSISVVWNQPEGVWTAVEIIVNGKNYTVDQGPEKSLNIDGVKPATTYDVSVTVLSSSHNGPPSRSETFRFPCTTDPRGVIAGSFFGVLIFIVLVCLIVFVLWTKKDLIRTRLPEFGGSKAAGSIIKEKRTKVIPVVQFPDHVSALTADQNRGFSMEYEILLTVGQEQTKNVALLPENKPRNRFVNIHPYDWSRVRLNTPNPAMVSDYINASYMPGYKTSREYIATQGPLPSTVNDFWRMIWEQKVKGIVMVTNCVEGGRTKCEKYWPEAGESALYGELQVTTGSDLENLFWTLREFNLKHSKMSEERTVRHFHFTAWPDHGVPEGTEALIRFRNLMREHIYTDSGGAPTVVHCSAGVGRTGTIIALDVLLQQLKEENGVDINAFVHKMRLRRPHMVQTESQYVFLHQCIMDHLQSTETEAHIYENSHTIYVNATALKALHSQA